MNIKELYIRKNDTAKLDVSWRLSDGDQSSYELFLIENGSVIERVKAPDTVMQCTLQTILQPMKEYALLLTVRSGQLLSSARAGFYSDHLLCQRVAY